MFDDQQTNQTQSDQTDSTDENSSFSSAAADLGMNPSDTPVSTVVTPTNSFQDDQADDTDSADDDSTTDEPTSDLNDNDDTTTEDASSAEVSGLSDDSPATDSSPTTGDLANLKQQALDQLSPLVHKLEQTPEEKYKTLMMLIQASDNQELLSEAYEAAQKISNEKARAEALLNIVNEINYFTQKG